MRRPSQAVRLRAVALAVLVLTGPRGVFASPRGGLASPRGGLGNAAAEQAGKAVAHGSEKSVQPAPEKPLQGGPTAQASAPHRCAAWNPERQALFGDLHVHTALSFDAESLGVRNLPADAYRFAKGDELGLQPYDASGKPLRHVRLERPLDFAAVTDHSELLGELRTCITPGMPGYDSLVCGIQRRWPLLAYILVSSRMLSTTNPERYSFCGEGGGVCREAAAGPWQTIRDAAEEAYDRTNACSFTSFVAYEWSGGPGGSMTHRNVLFADEKAPDLPVSFLDEPQGEGLWKRLERECAVKGCRFLTIPHNTNLSNGLLFSEPTADAASARHRAAVEPLVEVLQHKGDSECRAGAADEQCSFEKLPFSRMEEQPFHFRWKDPRPLSFVREVLGEGLRREAALGENPFRLGMIGSTDTHLGAAGLVSERAYPGHGAGGDTSRVEVPTVPDSVWFNPGGLAGVWAEENSRESIWRALQRREVWATSGPRIQVRFFGAWDWPDDLCRDPDLVAKGYAGGVPMGGQLAPAPTAASRPAFVVWAAQDAGTATTAGTALERVQVVKVWLEHGEAREQVLDVAGNAAADAAPANCSAAPGGSPSLCTVWRDPSWDPHSPALYYARVLQRPTCRWTGELCASRHVDCSVPATIDDDLAFCCDASVPLQHRERAVTSPIWVTALP